MARKITQKELKHDEFVDKAVDFSQWLEENFSTVLKWTGVVVVLVLALVGWRGYAANNLAKAKRSLAEGIVHYEEAQFGDFADSALLDSALADLRDVDDRVGRSGPGQVASFYRGASLFRLGRHEEAVAELQRLLEKSDPADTLWATAQMMLAQIHASQGRTEEAIALVQALVDAENPVIPTDRCLLELGRIQAAAGRNEDARASWQRIIDTSPQGAVAGEARVLLR